MCNNTYKSVPSEYNIKKIAEVLEADPLYLTGEREYVNEAEYLKSLADKYIETDHIGKMLKELNIVSLTKDKKYMCIYGRNKTDQIELNAAEYQRFKYYLVEQIRAVCENYVDICVMHDQNGFRIPG